MRPLAPEVAERRSGSVPRLLPKQCCKSRIVLLAALFAASVVARLPAQAAIPGISFPNGFVGDGASFTFNHDSGTGNPTINGSEIELTDGGKFESRSVYFNSTVDVAAFQTQFDFQIINPIADGFTFCIQRTSDTETGQGNGGMLGYYKIPESIAIKFDIWDQAVPHAVSTTGLFTNGAVPVDFIPPSIDVQAASGIDFHSGHVMRVLLTYAGGILNEQITDLTTKAVFNTEYNIDIPATIGASSSSPYAYVGFTAGTGADTSTQDLLNWTFTSNSPTPQDILKYRADAGDSGQYLSETTLNATNVNFNTFGKLFSFTVDGAIYAQPLYKSSVAITAGTYKGTTHNVIFVATENDSVYAFDADDAEGTTPLWKTSFLNAAQGITTIPESDQPSGNIDPVGITSTPVIDPTTGTIFVCAKSKQIISGTSHWYLRMHALDISSGVEKAGSGLAIADTTTTTLHGPAVYGNGSGATGGRVGYAVLTQNQRSALNLLNGTVYIASSGNSGDVPPYHGWVIGCSAFTYKVTAAWNANPNGADAGIWEGGAGLISDSNGYLYVATGNGTFTQPTYNTTTDSYTGGDYGDSIIKLEVDPTYTSNTHQNSNGWGLKVADYFTPFNQANLSGEDLDLGSGGPMLLPDAAGTAAHPHLLVQVGKEGTIYLVDTGTMGEYNAVTDQDVQEMAGVFTGEVFQSAGYYNTAFYFAGSDGANGQVFPITSGTFAEGTLTPDTFGREACAPIISANGSSDSNAILWSLSATAGTGQLRAYKASNIADELYTSDQAPNSRDTLGSIWNFAEPTVGNGRVYVPTKAGVIAYGLLPIK